MRLKTALPILWLPLIGVWTFLLSVQLNKTSTELESIVPLIAYVLVSFLLVLQLQLVIGNKKDVMTGLKLLVLIYEMQKNQKKMPAIANSIDGIVRRDKEEIIAISKFAFLVGLATKRWPIVASINNKHIERVYPLA